MASALNPGEHVLALDIGGTNIAAAVLDHEFNIVARCKKRTHTRKRKDTTQERVCKTARQALAKAGVKKLRGIGAGAPGTLDPEKGVIIDAVNLEWKGFPLAQTLSDAFGVPAAIDNDVNLGAYGEWCFGNLHDCRNVIGIFAGTGIGGGIILEGRIFHGHSGSTGEVGHTTVEAGGPFCGCGKRGCLEALASRIAIAEQVIALAARHDAPYIREHCGTDLERVRSGDLAAAIEAGDTQVEAVVRKAAYTLGIAAANLANILSPEAIVLGGGLVEAMQSLYLEEGARAIEEHALPHIAENLRLEPARLGDDAVIMGAARLAVEHIR